ncbi:hypothetical protein FB451DRAFT_1182280 [Mycena latifolia]|nr:hypothetical protein FB451DRAFT_1182280 [Mycena latifolia]
MKPALNPGSPITDAGRSAHGRCRHRLAIEWNRQSRRKQCPVATTAAKFASNSGSPGDRHRLASTVSSKVAGWHSMSDSTACSQEAASNETAEQIIETLVAATGHRTNDPNRAPIVSPMNQHNTVPSASKAHRSATQENPLNGVLGQPGTMGTTAIPSDQEKELFMQSSDYVRSRCSSSLARYAARYRKKMTRTNPAPVRDRRRMSSEGISGRYCVPALENMFGYRVLEENPHTSGDRSSQSRMRSLLSRESVEDLDERQKPQLEYLQIMRPSRCKNLKMHLESVQGGLEVIWNICGV